MRKYWLGLFSFVSKKRLFLSLILLLAAGVASAAGETAAGSEAAGHGAFALSFLWMAVVLLAAKLASLVEKVGQPAVLGELVIGVILGNLALLGLYWFDPIGVDHNIRFLAELGVVILLFQIGLESNIQKMKKVGVRALLVAILGVVVPFVMGTYLVGPWLLPGLSTNAYLFLGAALTATSVGITARVFRDLGKLQNPEAQIVLGAAVIDDVLGLIILAVVTAMVTVGAVSVGVVSWIVAKAVLFLLGSIVVGQILARMLSRVFSKIHTGVGMKVTLAVAFGLFFAYLAGKIGLAPIVGAFAAGLVLDPVHFKFFREPKLVEDLREVLAEAEPQLKAKTTRVLNHHAEHHIEDLIEPIAHFLVPIFFVVTGMNVRLDTLFDLRIILLALGITIAAFVGKAVAGLAAGKTGKAIVGVGMIPRGEVGLIFATIGHSLGVVSDEIFSIIVVMVILTTLIPPVILTWLLKKETKSAGLAEAPSQA